MSTSKYRQLPVKLSPTDVLARGKRAAQLQVEYCEVEEQKRSHAAAAGRRLKELREKVETALRAVRTGQELQDVAVTTVRDEARLVIETLRLDTYEVVDTRPMSPEERQFKLFSIVGRDEGSEADGGGQEAPTESAAPAEDAVVEDAVPQKPKARRAGAKGESGKPRRRRQDDSSSDPAPAAG